MTLYSSCVCSSERVLYCRDTICHLITFTLYSKNINVSYNWYATIYNYLYSPKLDCKFFNFLEIQKNQTPKKLKAWGKKTHTHTTTTTTTTKSSKPKKFWVNKNMGKKN